MPPPVLSATVHVPLQRANHFPRAQPSGSDARPALSELVARQAERIASIYETEELIDAAASLRSFALRSLRFASGPTPKLLMVRLAAEAFRLEHALNACREHGDSVSLAAVATRIATMEAAVQNALRRDRDAKPALQQALEALQPLQSLVEGVAERGALEDGHTPPLSTHWHNRDALRPDLAAQFQPHVNSVALQLAVLQPGGDPDDALCNAFAQITELSDQLRSCGKGENPVTITAIEHRITALRSSVASLAGEHRAAHCIAALDAFSEQLKMASELNQMHRERLDTHIGGESSLGESDRGHWMVRLDAWSHLVRTALASPLDIGTFVRLVHLQREFAELKREFAQDKPVALSALNSRVNVLSALFESAAARREGVHGGFLAHARRLTPDEAAVYPALRQAFAEAHAQTADASAAAHENRHRPHRADRSLEESAQGPEVTSHDARPRREAEAAASPPPERNERHPRRLRADLEIRRPLRKFRAALAEDRARAPAPVQQAPRRSLLGRLASTLRVSSPARAQPPSTPSLTRWAGNLFGAVGGEVNDDQRKLAARLFEEMNAGELREAIRCLRNLHPELGMCAIRRILTSPSLSPQERTDLLAQVAGPTGRSTASSLSTRRSFFKALMESQVEWTPERRKLVQRHLNVMRALREKDVVVANLLLANMDSAASFLGKNFFKAGGMAEAIHEKHARAQARAAA